MNRIDIETLTPVHIGSGRELSKNIEFLYFQEDEEDVFVVVDENKVLKIIGKENIEHWLNIIKNKDDFKDYLFSRKTDLKISDVSRRKMSVFCSNFSENKRLKEQLLNGLGWPYIPGSSLKGAIRTAVLSHFALTDKKLAKNNLKGKKGFSGQELEKKLFGNNPNEDVFRFLQVGDAYFEYETIALKTEVFNLFGNGWKIKNGESSLIEAIPEGAFSSCHFKIDKKLLDLNKSRKNTSFLDINKLFKIINKHTTTLLNSEIEFWQDENVQENAIEVHEGYIEWLQKVIDTAQKCADNEAVLRVGFGSGWDFITGSWANKKGIMNDFDYEKFLKVVRIKEYNDDVPFPKTRKIGDESDILGFIKISFK